MWQLSMKAMCIGVIYGGTRGTGTFTFWTGGTVPNISGRKGEESEVTCCQLNRGDPPRLNYNKTGSVPYSTEKAHDALSDPQWD